MKTRVVLTLGAVLAIALAGISPARAVEPEGRIGGTLTAAPTVVTLTSTATMPVRVVLAPDGPFTLEPSTFTLKPGETGTAVVSGDASGRVTASISALSDAAAGDTNSVVLIAGFPRPAPWSPPWGAILGGVLAVLVVLRGLVAVSRLRQKYQFVRRLP